MTKEKNPLPIELYPKDGMSDAGNFRDRDWTNNG